MIRKLLKSLREYKKPTLLTIFFAVIEVVFEILIPLCMSDLLDFGIEGGKMSIVVKDGTWLIVLAALQLLTEQGKTAPYRIESDTALYR